MFAAVWEILFWSAVSASAGCLFGVIVALCLAHKGGLVAADPSEPYPSIVDLTDPKGTRFHLTGVLGRSRGSSDPHHGTP